MKTAILILVIIVAGLGAIYLWQKPILQDKQNSIEPLVINVEDYATVAAEIGKQINDLSPTPPTEDTWIVRDVEFVKNEPYAYVVYHDTHNIFRILVETGWRPYQPDQKIRSVTAFHAIATFESAEGGWRLAHGEDLARGKETVKISPN